MANHKVHAVGGILAGAATFGGLIYWFSYPSDWERLPAFLVIGVLAALFPDIDTNSMGQDIFYGMFLAVDIVLIILKRYDEAAFLGLFAILPIVGRHRGWTHKWYAMILVPLVVVLLPVLLLKASPGQVAPYYLCACLGYFSHLLLDWEFR